MSVLRLLPANHQNIESAYRGAGLFPFNPQRVLRTLLNDEPSVKVDRPKTPHQYDIFDQVFVNCSQAGYKRGI
jgi:hypothetical protein